jgi:hypothetical protein
MVPPRNGELSHPKPGRAVAGQSVAKTQLEETIGFIEEFQYLKSMKPYRGGDSSVMIDMPPPESPLRLPLRYARKGARPDRARVRVWTPFLEQQPLRGHGSGSA